MHRAVYGKALTRESVGQALSSESLKSVQGTDAVSVADSNMDVLDLATTWTVLGCLGAGKEIGSLRGNCEIFDLTGPGTLNRMLGGRRSGEFCHAV